MKKIVVGILAVAIVASSAITGVAGHIKSQAATQGSNYVDCDGNGICDNYADKVCDGSNCGTVNVESDTVTESVPTVETVTQPVRTAESVNTASKGSNYVDSDGDGICDNYTGGNCQGNGNGTGSGCGNANAHHGGNGGGNCSHGGRNR